MADLSNVSVETLTEVMGWVKEAKEFAIEQAPLLAQEIVTYGKISNGLCLLLGVALITTCVICCRRLMKHGNEWDADDNLCLPVHIVVAIVSGIVSLPVILEPAFPFLKAVFAPRLYVIEKLSGLLK